VVSKRAAILVADDHAAARRVIVELLSMKPEWRVCAEAADGEEAVSMAKASCPDVAILDVSMPRKSGLQAAAEMLEFCPNVIIVSQSLHEEELIVEKLKQLGIKGYVHKLRLASDLVPTVEAVLKGETRFTM
jgi:DNA-binding NarL/FixJ family response regulator